MDSGSYLWSTPYISISYARAVRIGDIEVRATLHEHIDSLRVSSHDSLENGSHAVDVGVVHVCAVRNQHTSEVRVIFRNLCGMTQSRVPGYIQDVWRTTVFKQEFEGCQMEKPIVIWQRQSLTSGHDQRGIPEFEWRFRASQCRSFPSLHSLADVSEHLTSKQWREILTF